MPSSTPSTSESFGQPLASTVAPVVSVMAAAERQGLRNLTFLCAFKTVPPALTALLADPDPKTAEAALIGLGRWVPADLIPLVDKAVVAFAADLGHALAHECQAKVIGPASELIGVEAISVIGNDDPGVFVLTHQADLYRGCAAMFARIR